MEPLTFATIVGLIGLYKQERGAASVQDYQQFIGWLDAHRHQEIKDLISNTYHLQAEVDAILKADHDLMLKKLDAIGSSVASLVSRIDEFRPIVMKLVPSAELSEQAISILRQFVLSGDANFVMFSHMGGEFLALNNGNIEVTEPRFLKDDLSSLVASNLIAIESVGETVSYILTRNGLKWLEIWDKR